MCIIASKPANIAMPDETIITRMWNINPDGAGFMYTDRGKVHIRKGFMKLEDFLSAIETLSKKVNLTDVPMVMHFRITTHGGTCPENTHPFPISDSIKMLTRTSLTTNIGVAHNGVIHSVIPRKGISDTMEYIASQLAPLSRALPTWYTNKDAIALVENAIKSKLAVLDNKGRITLLGDFIESNGISYSNRSFEPSYTRYKYSWSWEDDTCYYGYSGSATKTTAKGKAKNKSKSKNKSTAKGTSTEPKTISDYSPLIPPYATYPVSQKELMCVDTYDEAAYVRHPKTGHVLSGIDFLIDKDNKVYTYNWTNDCAVPCPGYIAYTSANTPLHFDRNASTLEYIDESYADDYDPFDDETFLKDEPPFALA